MRVWGQEKFHMLEALRASVFLDTLTILLNYSYQQAINKETVFDCSIRVADRAS